MYLVINTTLDRTASAPFAIWGCNWQRSPADYCLGANWICRSPADWWCVLYSTAEVKPRLPSQAARASSEYERKTELWMLCGLRCGHVRNNANIDNRMCVTFDNVWHELALADADIYWAMGTMSMPTDSCADDHMCVTLKEAVIRFGDWRIVISKLTYAKRLLVSCKKL